VAYRACHEQPRSPCPRDNGAMKVVTHVGLGQLSLPLVWTGRVKLEYALASGSFDLSGSAADGLQHQTAGILVRCV
jgi:hypothetical protein